jgi:soluble lytic murein transglycosylase-like protein
VVCPLVSFSGCARLVLQDVLVALLRRLGLFLGLSLVIAQASVASVSQASQDELSAIRASIEAETEGFIDEFAAQVWLLDMSKRLSRFVKDPHHRVRILKSVYAEAVRHDLPPELVLALIEVESAFQSYALSSAGAMGYMQVMPFWKKEIGRPADNLMELVTNLRYGCSILKHYHRKEKGNWVRALARYNGSLGQLWYPERVLKAWEKRWYVNY